MRNSPVMRAVALTALLSGAAACRRAPTGGELLMVDGPVRVNGRAAVVGARLAGGAVVECDDGGGTEIRLGGDAAIRLKGPARLTLGGGSAVGWDLGLDRGWLMSAVKPDRKFTVRTPLAAASVRGTLFFVSADGPDDAYVCVCEGALHVSAEGVERDLRAAHHEAVAVTRQDGATSAAPATMARHTDQDVAAVAARLAAGP